MNAEPAGERTGVMTPESFVSHVRSAIVEQSAATYRHMFESFTPETAPDPLWKRALALHRSLSEPERSVLVELMRQASVDTVSNLFGVLDGSTSLADSREEFVLLSKPDNQLLSGNLQDLFLEADERERK
jgi:hypothetical protein